MEIASLRVAATIAVVVLLVIEIQSPRTSNSRFNLGRGRGPLCHVDCETLGLIGKHW